MSIIEESLQRTTDTKACRIGPGALSYVPGMFRELFGDRRAILVADGNTYRAAGEEVERLLREAGIGLEPSFIFRDPDLYAEWGYLKRLENYLSGTDAIAVAVGSGVINDLTVTRLSALPSPMRATSRPSTAPPRPAWSWTRPSQPRRRKGCPPRAMPT